MAYKLDEYARRQIRVRDEIVRQLLRNAIRAQLAAFGIGVVAGAGLMVLARYLGAMK